MIQFHCFEKWINNLKFWEVVLNQRIKKQFSRFNDSNRWTEKHFFWFVNSNQWIKKQKFWITDSNQWNKVYKTLYSKQWTKKHFSFNHWFESVNQETIIFDWLIRTSESKKHLFYQLFGIMNQEPVDSLFLCLSL